MTEQFEEMGRLDGGWMRGSEFAVDVAESDEEIVVTADLPGFEKSDIDVSVSERTLTIRADSETDAERDDGAYLRRERRHSSVRRSIPSPATSSTTTPARPTGTASSP
ncbi:Hsp20/alpha crystallin family protein [Haloplanus sp. GCM10025708]|uniref:Hsp20/alpha crystallin family protein n=1 Tax=Haloplanus sp. GCM10025708 TaxID=3252679 RepID=UPI003623450E